MVDVNISAPLSASGDRSFRMGGVVVKSFGAYFRNILHVNVVALSIWLPWLAAMGVLYLISENKTVFGDFSRYWFAVTVARQAVGGAAILLLLLYPISGGIIFHIIFRSLRDGRVRFLTSLSQGFARGFYIILLVLLMTAILSAATATTLVPISKVVPRPDASWLLSLILPIYLGIIWLVALPACVIEGLGPIASLGRSRRLTLGHRWRLLGVVLIFAALLGLAIYALALYGNQTTTTRHIFTVLFCVALIGGFICVIPAVVYHELRRAKEGRDIQSLSSVFD